MRTNKSIKADASGCTNLGKHSRDQQFSLSEEDEKIVLEPARELSARENKYDLLLNEEEWSRFQKIMDSDDEPNENLLRLMQDPEK